MYAQSPSQLNSGNFLPLQKTNSISYIRRQMQRDVEDQGSRLSPNKPFNFLETLNWPLIIILITFRINFNELSNHSFLEINSKFMWSGESSFSCQKLLCSPNSTTNNNTKGTHKCAFEKHWQSPRQRLRIARNMCVCIASHIYIYAGRKLCKRSRLCIRARLVSTLQANHRNSSISLWKTRDTRANICKVISHQV